MNDRALDSPELSPLERLVLECALARNTGDNPRLREQADAATVSTRTLSGVGFMTKLVVPGAFAVPGAPADETLPRVFGSHPDLPAGAEFVLQVTAGRLNTIEAFCFEGIWPRDESLFRLEAGP